MLVTESNATEFILSFDCEPELLCGDGIHRVGMRRVGRIIVRFLDGLACVTILSAEGTGLSRNMSTQSR